MNPTSPSTSPAARQQKYRESVSKEFGLRPVTWLLTPAEEQHLKSRFEQQYGHGLTLAERRRHRDKQEALRKTSATGGQMTFL